MNFPLPVELCEKETALQQYGLYRRLEDGKLEFFSICNPAVKDFNGIWGPHLQNLLNTYLPDDNPMPDLGSGG